VLGPRVLASGDASLKKNSRNLNPNVPVYTWNSHSSIAPENLLTCVKTLMWIERALPSSTWLRRC
jgi:hypothetical protein